MVTGLNRIPGKQISNGWDTFKDMSNILHHHRNAKQNDSDSYTSQNDSDQKTEMTAYVGKAVKKEYSSTAGGSTSLYSHFRNEHVGFSENWESNSHIT